MSNLGPFTHDQVPLTMLAPGFTTKPTYGTFWRLVNSSWNSSWDVWQRWANEDMAKIGITGTKVVGIRPDGFGGNFAYVWKDVTGDREGCCLRRFGSAPDRLTCRWDPNSAECQQVIDAWCPVYGQQQDECRTVDICMGRLPGKHRPGYSPGSPLCDQFMRTYCNDATHKTEAECACFAQSTDATDLLKNKPHCFDARCAARSGIAYMTGSQAAETCPSLNYQVCRQIFQMGDAATQNMLTATQQQQCKQLVEAGTGTGAAASPAAPTTVAVPAQPAGAGTGTGAAGVMNDPTNMPWLIGGGVAVGVVLILLVVVAVK